MLYFILKSCSLLCSSLKMKAGSACPLTTQVRQIIDPVSFLFKKTITSYPASRGYIFAVWAVLRKVASARNSSLDSQAKLIVSSVVKWRESRENKEIATTLICFPRLAQCSKPVKNRKKSRFLIYLSRFLDGFERLSAEATFCTPAHTAKMYPLLAG